MIIWSFDSFPSLPDIAANNWVLGYWAVGHLTQQNWTGRNLWLGTEVIKKFTEHPYVHCSLMYNNQETEATQVPTCRQVAKRLWYYIQWSIT